MIALLHDKLHTRRSYSTERISKALNELSIEAGNPNSSLYDNKKKVYSLLRWRGRFAPRHNARPLTRMTVRPQGQQRQLHDFYRSDFRLLSKSDTILMVSGEDTLICSMRDFFTLLASAGGMGKLNKSAIPLQTKLIKAWYPIVWQSDLDLFCVLSPLAR